MLAQQRVNATTALLDKILVRNFNYAVINFDDLVILAL